MTNPTELCQLAGTWRGNAPPAPGLMAEEKIDGWRALYFPGYDGEKALWTRGGMKIEGVGHILHRLGLMEEAAGHSLFIDGEFQVDGCLSATKRWCESGWKCGGEAGTFHGFDCVPLEQWRTDDCPLVLVDRKNNLSRYHKASFELPVSWEYRAGTHGKEPDGPIVTIEGDLWCSDVPGIMEEAGRIWASGGEGLMLKDAESLYRRGRSDTWQKVKHPRYVAK